MKKAELAKHHSQYYSLVASAAASQRSGLVRESLGFAVASLEHMDGAIQYERKYEKTDLVSLEAIELILTHAPLIFEFESLNQLEISLKVQRRIERNLLAEIAAKLAAARELMRIAHRLWDCLERHADFLETELRSNFECHDSQWPHLADTWETMGVLIRTSGTNSQRWALATRMDGHAMGKCPSCGATGKGQKAKMLDAMTCPKCRSTVQFVFISTGRGSAA
jgi:hypothetical protein